MTSVGVAVSAPSSAALLPLGRLTSVHAYVSASPSGSLEPEPSSTTVSPTAAVTSEPASAIGAPFAGGGGGGGFGVPPPPPPPPPHAARPLASSASHAAFVATWPRPDAERAKKEVCAFAARAKVTIIAYFSRRLRAVRYRLAPQVTL